MSEHAGVEYEGAVCRDTCLFLLCDALHNEALRAPGGLAHFEVEVLGAVVYNCPLCVGVCSTVFHVGGNPHSLPRNRIPAPSKLNASRVHMPRTQIPYLSNI